MAQLRHRGVSDNCDATGIRTYGKCAAWITKLYDHYFISIIPETVNKAYKENLAS